MSDTRLPLHEEGEPERITEPDEPLSEETLAALAEMGVEIPVWLPKIPPKKSYRLRARIRSIRRGR